jgi:ferric-dicitrate binding protein FerR (iron transport regulator)
MNYQNYQTEDFLADEEFKLWVIDPTEERNDFWQSWLKANPEKIPMVKEAAEIIKSLNFTYIDPTEQQYEETLNRILKSDQTRIIAVNADKQHNLFYYLRRIAAAILVLFSIGYFWLQNQKEEPLNTLTAETIVKENPFGQKSTFTLPDGTVVNLNAGSSLTFPSLFNDSIRMVHLNGEAYFRVKHDTTRRFVVKSGNIFTTALGTSFNVRNFTEENEVSIALVEGKVKIETGVDGNNASFLLPGEKLVYHNSSGLATKTVFDSEFITGWKEGLLVFEDADLSEFIITLERWYGVKFKVEGVKQDTWHIKGKFNNESLEEILEGFSFSYDLEYEINEHIVTLKL